MSNQKMYVGIIVWDLDASPSNNTTCFGPYPTIEEAKDRIIQEYRKIMVNCNDKQHMRNVIPKMEDCLLRCMTYEDGEMFSVTELKR
jgi:hypothetical protein